MSRYQWPKPGRIDRVAERMAYNANTNGVLPPDTLAPSDAEALMALDASFAPPGGDPDLWVPIGPSTVLAGQGGSRPRVAGRVRDLAVSPEGTRAYAASANGGVWYTRDAGISWLPLGNWVPTPTTPPIDRAANVLACGCLLVKFGLNGDESGDDVYVGTGELVPAQDVGLPGDRVGGVGVLHLDKLLPAALADPFGNHWKREAKNLTGAGIYRLARDPVDENRLIAATSIGLFTRSGAFVEDSDWQKVTAAPFNFDPLSGRLTTDVVWVSTPPRLWVAFLAGSESGLYTSTTGVNGPYQKVPLLNVVTELPHAPGPRLGIAVAPSNKTILYVLGTGPKLWRISGTIPTEILNLPKLLFGDAEGDQSGYDLAIAVHPDNPNQIVVGGAALSINQLSNAALFRFNIVGQNSGFANQVHPELDPTYIGAGVHPDIHQVQIVKVGGQFHVWVACDGGVFRSPDGTRDSFGARNTGLAILECGFVASHPESDAFVVTGAQDNGVVIRIGDTVWLHSLVFIRANNFLDVGDGGGAVIHPVKKRFFAAQNIKASWFSNGVLSPPVERHSPVTPSEKLEGQNSFFYSSADVVRVGATDQVRLAIGTNRVWLADNWDPEAAATAWVTLPNGHNDARTPGSENDDQDTVGDKSGKIVACRWVDENRLLFLMRSDNKEGRDSVVRMLKRQADGSWKVKDLSNHHNRCFDFDNGDIPESKSSFLPPLGAWSDIAVNVAGAEDSVSCYVACTGHPGADRMDTLWWYNGAGDWFPTGLATPRNAPPASIGTKAPAYAVVVDPADSDVVYVGTAIGVWKGTRSFDPDTNPPQPLWVFRPYSNGLPEAAVQDLSFFYPSHDVLHPGPKLLRAAVQSRGIWEVDLGTPPGPLRRTYLRMHPTDARRVLPTSRVIPIQVALPIWRLHASPDVRIRQAPLEAAEVPPAAPATLPWHGAADNRFQLWIFQTALHRLDPLVRPDGNWSAQFAARLTQFRDPVTNVPAGNQITATLWGHVVTLANVFTDPWDGSEPTEADLLELIVEPIQSPDLIAGPSVLPPMPPRKLRVDVLVHHRDSRPVAAGDVRVALFRRPLSAVTAEPVIPISADWKDKVAQLMGGGVPAALPDTWEIADPIRTLQPSAGVDARTPRAVTFNVDFTGKPNGGWILLAVVHSVPDPVSAATLVGNDVKELVLNSHQVATRVMRISP
jgi:hypothetical protein